MPEAFSSEELASIRESLPEHLRSLNDADLSSALIAEFQKIDQQIASAAAAGLAKLPDVVSSMSPTELVGFANLDKDALSADLTKGIMAKIEKDLDQSTS